MLTPSVSPLHVGAATAHPEYPKSKRSDAR